MQRTVRLAIAVVYGVFLVQAGLLLLVTPWSPAWGRVVIAAPGGLGPLLAEGAVRGIVSAIGVLALLLAAAELITGLAAGGPPRGRPG